MNFSTPDQDNDRRNKTDKSASCAKLCHGSWWYRDCYHSNLNGRYIHFPEPYGWTANVYGLVTEAIIWAEWPSPIHWLQYTEMKIRPFDV